MSTTTPLRTSRLMLTPLHVADAPEMVDVLADPSLYSFTGGAPPTLAQLEERYQQQTAGAPRDGETWHNWILRLDGTAIGFVQATVADDAADLAWVVGATWQGLGFATEASRAVRDWLVDHGTTRFAAHIHPDHRASGSVATKLGLQPTGTLDDEGEMIWS